MPAAKKATVSRSAKSGEFVSKAKAEKAPSTTVTETVERKPREAKPKAPKRSEEFERKARLYELAIRQGTPRDYPYGNPNDPEWEQVREVVLAKVEADEAEAAAEARRVAEENDKLNEAALAE